jgi:hypothetical protein
MTPRKRVWEEISEPPYVVGADWFQYYDEPTHGRADGENYNFGLVDKDLNTRCVAAMALPASLFGRSRFHPGDRVGLASTFHTHCRAYRVAWRGNFTLEAGR